MRGYLVALLIVLTGNSEVMGEGGLPTTLSRNQVRGGLPEGGLLSLIRSDFLERRFWTARRTVPELICHPEKLGFAIASESATIRALTDRPARHLAAGRRSRAGYYRDIFF
jgi:hypothetical protein